MFTTIRTGAVSLAAVLAACGAMAAPPELRVHGTGDVRVLYFAEGPGAVRPADRNGNGVSDQVEDVLTQTVAARLLFVDVLGFPDPLRSERFRAARHLDIKIRDRAVLGSNGVAYDELQRFRVPGDPAEARSIGFAVASSVEPAQNLTPAHEFFHLVQYGATHFKNGWFQEGMARWSERGLGADPASAVRPLADWPLPAAAVTGLFAQTYGAADAFWRPLAARFDPGDGLPESPALHRLRAMAYTDGTPALRDLKLPGWRLMRDVLLELQATEAGAFRRLGHADWSEANQRAPGNDPEILGAVGRVVAKRMRP